MNMRESKSESAILFLTEVAVAGKFALCALLPCALPGAIAFKIRWFLGKEGWGDDSC